VLSDRFLAWSQKERATSTTENDFCKANLPKAENPIPLRAGCLGVSMGLFAFRNLFDSSSVWEVDNFSLAWWWRLTRYRLILEVSG
jgi:hypothetical protein